MEKVYKDSKKCTATFASISKLLKDISELAMRKAVESDEDDKLNCKVKETTKKSYFLTKSFK